MFHEKRWHGDRQFRWSINFMFTFKSRAIFSSIIGTNRSSWIFILYGWLARLFYSQRRFTAQFNSQWLYFNKLELLSSIAHYRFRTRKPETSRLYPCRNIGFHSNHLANLVSSNNIFVLSKNVKIKWVNALFASHCYFQTALRVPSKIEPLSPGYRKSKSNLWHDDPAAMSSFLGQGWCSSCYWLLR